MKLAGFAARLARNPYPMWKSLSRRAEITESGAEVPVVTLPVPGTHAPTVTNAGAFTAARVKSLTCSRTKSQSGQSQILSHSRNHLIPFVLVIQYFLCFFFSYRVTRPPVFVTGTFFW